jgi:hypothetical protein
VLGGILESLTAVSGRKHPSAAQSKVLRANLPLLPVLGYFASSSVFATEMLTKSFLTSVATLLVSSSLKSIFWHYFVVHDNNVLTLQLLENC